MKNGKIFFDLSAEQVTDDLLAELYQLQSGGSL
jgi:ABC-type phosphate/phosphonate transport system ATPase subunit